MAKGYSFDSTQNYETSVVVSGSILNTYHIINEKVQEGWDTHRYFKASVKGSCYLPNTEVMFFSRKKK